jgi:hypothetical protein
LSQQSQTIFDLPKVLAVGIASPAATVLTSRFGVAGTLLGLVVSAMFVTAAADFLKVYLSRVPGAVTTIPGGLKEKSLFRRVFERIKVPFSKFGSLPRPQRRSILLRSVVAAGVSILVGLIIITSLEFGVGKSLSCWVWDECPTEVAAEGASSTLPSILGGGQSTGTSTPQEAGPSEDGPSNVQQQPDYAPGTPEAPSQAPDDPSVQPGQRQGPAGVPEKVEVQQQPPPGAAEDQQQPAPGDAPEESGE